MPLEIIYVDDEPKICEMFEDTFTSASIHIKTFIDPALAIDYINEHRPDLVFLDFRFPGTTGDIIAKKLDPSLPKVLVTGDLEVVTQAVFIEKFQKPFPWKKIEAFLSEWAERKVA